MRVRLAGQSSVDGRTYYTGIQEMPDADAEHLILLGRAVPLNHLDGPEIAVVGEPELAARVTHRTRRRTPAGRTSPDRPAGPATEGTPA